MFLQKKDSSCIRTLHRRKIPGFSIAMQMNLPGWVADTVEGICPLTWTTISQKDTGVGHHAFASPFLCRENLLSLLAILVVCMKARSAV